MVAEKPYIYGLGYHLVVYCYKALAWASEDAQFGGKMRVLTRIPEGVASELGYDCEAKINRSRNQFTQWESN